MRKVAHGMNRVDKVSIYDADAIDVARAFSRDGAARRHGVADSHFG